MSQTILDDGINVMGSGLTPPPDPIPPTLTAPEDGALVPNDADLAVTGTADPTQGTLTVTFTVAGTEIYSDTPGVSNEGNWLTRVLAQHLIANTGEEMTITVTQGEFTVTATVTIADVQVPEDGA